MMTDDELRVMASGGYLTPLEDRLITALRQERTYSEELKSAALSIIIGVSPATDGKSIIDNWRVKQLADHLRSIANVMEGNDGKNVS